MTSSSEKRASDLRIWVVSTFFFLSIISGGTLLGLYIIHPETKENAWYPVAGMILVAIPWLFWFMTFFYRCCIKVAIANIANRQAALKGKRKSGGGAAPAASAAAATTPTLAADDSKDDDDAWRVGVECEGTSQGEGIDRNKSPHEASTHSSHESEVPLAHAMAVS